MQQELLHDRPETLTQAVYIYDLEIMNEEIPVYSATNTNDHRFDVVRVKLNPQNHIPNLSQRGSELDSELIEIIFRRMQGAVAHTNPLTTESARSILADLDALADQVAMDESSSEEPPSPERAEEALCNVVADRLLSIGAPSSDYSWYPGYSWTIATCTVCGDHLGWIFHSPDNEVVFQTLIVTKLREKSLDNSQQNNSE